MVTFDWCFCNLLLQYSAIFIALLFTDCKSVMLFLIGQSLQFSRCDFLWPLRIHSLCLPTHCLFTIFSVSLDCQTPVPKRFSVLQTIHLQLCSGGKLSSTCCLLSTSYNFKLAICGLSSNFFVYFRKLFIDFSQKPSTCVL